MTRTNRMLVCSCQTSDEMLLWEWLGDARRHRVERTGLRDDCVWRRTAILFDNELDAQRFRRWAEGRGFAVDDERRATREPTE